MGASTAASPAAVWRRLAAFDRIADWAPPVDHSSALTETRRGVGAARRVQVGSATLVETVTAWEVDRELAYTIEGLPPLVGAVETRWTLTPDGEGTVVGVHTEITPGPRPPMKLAAKAAGRRLRKANDEMLAGLLRAAEADTTEERT